MPTAPIGISTTTNVFGAKIGVKVNQSIKSDTVVTLLRTVMLLMGIYLIIRALI